MLRIDGDVMDAIEKWAADEFRSVNGQLEWIIDKSLKDARRKPGISKNTDNVKDEES